MFRCVRRARICCEDTAALSLQGHVHTRRHQSCPESLTFSLGTVQALQPQLWPQLAECMSEPRTTLLQPLPRVQVRDVDGITDVAV